MSTFYQCLIIKSVLLSRKTTIRILVILFAPLTISFTTDLSQYYFNVVNIRVFSYFLSIGQLW